MTIEPTQTGDHRSGLRIGSGAAPALLILLPGGFYVSGVVTWAVSLVNELAARGVECGLVVHQTRNGYAPVKPVLHPAVHLYDVSELGDFERGTIDLNACRQVYGELIASYKQREQRVVVLPNLHGDCYGAAVDACAENSNSAAVGWCHLDSDYDRYVLTHYGQALARVVAVSGTLAKTMRQEHPKNKVIEIGYGVEFAPPAQSATRDQHNITIAYTGRLDTCIKRIDVLPIISDLLTARGLFHSMTIIGDGPDGEILPDSNINITVQRARPPSALSPLLAATDLFVLPSRAEGQSLAMLQAMRCGAVPLVTSPAASEVISHGNNGYLIEQHESAHVVAERFAACIGAYSGLPGSRKAEMAAAAVAAAEPYSIELHADKVLTLLREVNTEILAGVQARWQRNTPWNFTGLGGAVVGPGAAERMVQQLTLAVQSGLPIAVYGTGNHTHELKNVLEPFIQSIACFIDDNPRDQYLWGRPVVTLAEGKHALAEGGTVIVSSRIHAYAMRARAAAACPRVNIITLYDTVQSQAA